jgi:hypothetical protein
MKNVLSGFAFAMVFTALGFGAGWLTVNRFQIESTYPRVGGYVILNRFTGESRFYTYHQREPLRVTRWSDPIPRHLQSSEERIRDLKEWAAPALENK